MSLKDIKIFLARLSHVRSRICQFCFTSSTIRLTIDIAQDIYALALIEKRSNSRRVATLVHDASLRAREKIRVYSWVNSRGSRIPRLRRRRMERKGDV